MDIRQIIESIPAESAGIIKGSGVAGSGVAAFGLTFDATQFPLWIQVAESLGIFMGGLAALITIFYTIYKSRK